jgi:hypothetical protein
VTLGKGPHLSGHVLTCEGKRIIAPSAGVLVKVKVRRELSVLLSVPLKVSNGVAAAILMSPGSGLTALAILN